MKHAFLFVCLVSLQSHAATFSKSYQKLFLSQDQVLVQGTERAIQIAKTTGRNVVMIFPSKTINANGEKSAAAVTVSANDQTPAAAPAKDNFMLVSGLSFEAIVGTEGSPEHKVSDEGEHYDTINNDFMINERLVVRLFNNRAAVYGGADWNVDAFDHYRVGARVNIVSEQTYSDDGYDLYVYGEASPGKPKDTLVADQTHATGIGYMWSSKKGNGVVLETGISFYDRPAFGDTKRGYRIAAGYVKQWGNKKRTE